MYKNHADTLLTRPPEKEQMGKISEEPPTIEKESTRSIFQNNDTPEKPNSSVSRDVPRDTSSHEDSSVSKYFTGKTKTMYTNVPPKLGRKSTKSRKKVQKVISKPKPQSDRGHNNELNWFR